MNHLIYEYPFLQCFFSHSTMETSGFRKLDLVDPWMTDPSKANSSSFFADDRKLITHLLNKETVCRAAPATSGLSIVYYTYLFIII